MRLYGLPYLNPPDMLFIDMPDCLTDWIESATLRVLLSFLCWKLVAGFDYISLVYSSEICMEVVCRILIKTKFMSIVGKLIGRSRRINEEDIYQCMLEIHFYFGKKITISNIASLLNCSARTIQRNMPDQLKKEKDQRFCFFCTLCGRKQEYTNCRT